MIAGLLLTLAVYAAVLAAWTAAYALRGRGPTPRHAAVALVLWTGLAVHALWRLATLIGGTRPPDLAVAVGYVIASVLVLPLAAGSVTPTLDDRRSIRTTGTTGWDAGALSIASVATVVVAARIDATWL